MCFCVISCFCVGVCCDANVGVLLVVLVSVLAFVGFVLVLMFMGGGGGGLVCQEMRSWHMFPDRRDNYHQASVLLPCTQ